MSSFVLRMSALRVRLLVLLVCERCSSSFFSESSLRFRCFRSSSSCSAFHRCARTCFRHSLSACLLSISSLLRLAMSSLSSFNWSEVVASLMLRFAFFSASAAFQEACAASQSPRFTSTVFSAFSAALLSACVPSHAWESLGLFSSGPCLLRFFSCVSFSLAFRSSSMRFPVLLPCASLLLRSSASFSSAAFRSVSKRSRLLSRNLRSTSKTR
mmetsp:Transcript_24866/g.56305  ORF Transcript_24866/g.56305 Transcript_24866/m.56305 type:complete len:213 (-) Transcript_24866:327-965(-)